jgi:hypothetical protein
LIAVVAGTALAVVVPKPRLGWVFTDRFVFYTPFIEAPPQPHYRPDYLARQVTTTGHSARAGLVPHLAQAPRAGENRLT